MDGNSHSGIDAKHSDMKLKCIPVSNLCADPCHFFNYHDFVIEINIIKVWRAHRLSLKINEASPDAKLL